MSFSHFIKRQTARYVCTQLLTLLLGIILGISIVKYAKYSNLFPKYTNDTIPNGVYATRSGRNAEVAAQLYRKVRILCLVMTSPKHHKKRAIFVKRTWGRHCNKLLFMSTMEDEAIDSIALPVPEGRNYLWGKTKASFRYAYERHLNDFDWFYKVDDDTFAVMENLRYMLHRYDTEMPIYFGCRLKKFVKQGYMSGGSGYVLSRAALRRFVEIGLIRFHLCKSGDIGTEDVEMGRCLDNVFVKPGDTRDAVGRQRFLPLPLPFHLRAKGNATIWFNDYSYYPSKWHWQCCSDYAISFHYMSSNDMYVYYYLIYHTQVYGLGKELPPLPTETKNDTRV